MKKRLLSCLFLVQLILMPVSLFGKGQDTPKRKPAHLELLQHTVQTKGCSPLITGYVEDSRLILFFHSSLQGVYLQVTDQVTGMIVFEGCATASSLDIPLEYVTTEFEIVMSIL